MADIRSFFGSKDSITTSKRRESRGQPKPLISGSDSSNDEVQGTPRSDRRAGKRKLPLRKNSLKALSDSDDDFESASVQRSPIKKSCPISNIDRKAGVKKAKTLEAVNAQDFFASACAKMKPVVGKEETSKRSKKRNTPDVEFHDDADFAALLLDMDNETDPFSAQPSPHKKIKSEPPPPTAASKDYASKSLSSKLSTKVKSETSYDSGKVKLKSQPPTQTTNLHPPPQSIVHENKETCKKSNHGPSSPQNSKTSFDKKIKKTKQDDHIETTIQQLWVDKYKPTNTKGIIGQQGDSSNMRKLYIWLQNWKKYHVSGATKPSRPPPWHATRDDGSWAKCALLSGPPGVGKTTTAYLVSKELGYEVMEMNASDTRSKKQLEAFVSEALTSKSVTSSNSKRVMLMDEVDGMAGNEDRGGVAQLIQLIKQSKIPVICMCNDRNHPKIRNLANYCFDLRFSRPRAEQIKAAMLSICFKEKVRISPDALIQLIVGCNQDIRHILHHLSLIKVRSGNDDKMTPEEAKIESDKSKKTSIKVGPWDVCRKVFSSSEHKSMSLMDKSDLFFHDYSLGPLFVQENYLSVTPDVAGKDKKKTMLLVSKASDSVCDGDLVEKAIRSKNAWNLLPVEAMFASVIPGEYMSGYLSGQIQFPSWLGRHSKTNKYDRILQELQIHTRLSSGQSKGALNRDMLQHLRDAILRPMLKGGSDGVKDSVEVMSHYALLREDLDNLLEVCLWPDGDDPMKQLESKVKAAFTRAYKKDVVLPYSTNIGAVVKKVKAAEISSLDEVEDEDPETDNDQIENDAMIKLKPQKTKATQQHTSGRGRGSKVGRGRKRC